jgi:putative hydrolase of the HAD superfamily
MSRPEAVLLDVGGVLLLPEPERICAAFERAGSAPPRDRLERAHYTAAAGFTTECDALADWGGCWQRYLDDYVDACGVPESERESVHRHLDSEFADAALWSSVEPAARDGLAHIAGTGVRLGIVSNADGVMGERLRRLELVQVGPGVGVEVGCVIDSGTVGVMKPDPRIFQLALDALGLDAGAAWYVGDIPGIDVVGARRAGLRAFLFDPFDLHHGADYDRVGSLTELARMVDVARGGRASARSRRLTRESARDASRRGDGAMARWVGDFLASRGSDNATLASGLAQSPHWWAGPLRVRLDDLVTLAGPEGDDVLCTVAPEDWERDVEHMEEHLDEGWEPPPLVAQFDDGRLLLQDGNHRYDAMRRAGERDAWVIVWFDSPDARDAFVAARPSSA